MARRKQKKEKPLKIASARMHRLPPYLFAKLNRRKHVLRQQGCDVIDLGMGNPTDPTPDRVVEKLRSAAGIARNQRYSDSRGVFNLRRELARHYARHWDVELDPESEVIATIGSKEGFSHLCLAILGPGDTALVTTPTFPIHIYGVVLAGANVIGLTMNNGEEALLRNISLMCTTLYPRPKVLILNYPNNPTTRTVELPFFEDVVKLARKYDFVVVHDFAYAQTVFDGYKAPSFLQVRGAKKVGVELATMSKPYNMAGWRVGFMAGNSDMIKCLSDVKGYYDYGIFQAIQIASIIALRHCDGEARKQAAVYQERRDVLCAGLERIGWELSWPRATMFAWVPIPEQYRKMGSIEFAMQALEKAYVAIAPGGAFSEDGEGYLRIALVENPHRLRQAIRQINRVFPVKNRKR